MPVRRDGVVQRLDAEPVAHQQQPAPRLVPEREREHAAKTVNGLLSPLFVRVDDHFGVRAGPEAMTGSLQLGSDLHEVVDLAVENHPHGPVFVGQRLVAGRQIDDAQTAVSEAEAGRDVESVRVRAAMGDDGRHGARAVPDRSGLRRRSSACRQFHT